MITTDGKSILGKFLVGQAPAYASYLAVGCGHNPTSSSAITDFSAKTELDFEMFRVPITSRSFYVENGVSKIVFGAELPTQDRFSFTEAGIYSAGTNPIATGSDSRILYSFSSTESWERHDNSGTSSLVSTSIASTGNQGVLNSPTAYFSSPYPTLIDSTLPIFENPARIQYKEQPRFYESSIVIPGGYSTINTQSTTWTFDQESHKYHLHLTGQNLTLDQNSPSDKLTLAFSVLNVGTSAASTAELTPKVDILIQFSSDETETNAGEYAQMQITVDNADYASNNGYTYFIRSQTIGDLKKSASFSWGAVKVVKVFVQSSEDDNTLILLDGLRFENSFDNIANPAYGLVSYAPIYNVVSTNYQPALKEENSKNILQINFDIDINEES